MLLNLNISSFYYALFMITAIILIVHISEEDRKKRGLITSSTLSEVSPNTMHSYTSKCPRRWRERNTVTLECFFNFGEISESKNKANASFLYVFCLFYSISDYFKLMYLDFWHESRFLAVLACETNDIYLFYHPVLPWWPTIEAIPNGAKIDIFLK